MVTCFRNNCDIFIDQLPVSITKIATDSEDGKTVVTEVWALNSNLLFVDIIFAVANMQQNSPGFKFSFKLL